MNVRPGPVRTKACVSMESTVIPANVVRNTKVSDIPFPPYQHPIACFANWIKQRFLFIHPYNVCYVKLGKQCEVEQDPCSSKPCERGGVCKPSADFSSYTCKCAAGWEGMCALLNTVYLSAYSWVIWTWDTVYIMYYCYNNAVLIFGLLAPDCVGTRCKEDVNECKSYPCKNGGNCVNNQGSYMCKCISGYSGHNCQTDIDDCSPSEFYVAF